MEGVDGANDLIAAVRLGLRLLRDDARVVFVHCPECMWAVRLARWLRRRRPVALVAVWHGAGPDPARVLRPRGDARARLLALFRTMQERSALGADAHIAVHASVVDDLRRHHGFRSQVAIVENALAGEDLERLWSIPRPRPCPSPGGAAHDRPVAVWVGQTGHRKGLDVALAAVRLARRRLPELRLLVAGVPAQDPQPGVEWCGVVPPDRMIEVYAAADVLLFPTRYESFGLVVLEAMAAGLPVVVSDALPGGMVSDGRNGRVVAGHRPTDYARALLDVLGDGERALEMGRCNRQDAGRFSLAGAAESYAELAAALG